MKNIYVWQVTLQVTSSDRPALRHELQYRVEARSDERAIAIDKAKSLATRDGHTVTSVTGATRGYCLMKQA